MSKKICVALSTFCRYSDAPLNILKESPFEYTVNTSGRRLTEDELIEQVAGCHGVMAGVEPYSARVLQALPELEVISRCGVGIDSIDASAAKENNVEICNTPDVVIQPVAELALAMMFDLLKNVTGHTILLKQNKWERLTGRMFTGMNIGILGLGRIGRRVAELAKALGASVSGADLYPDKAWADQWGVSIVSTEELLRSCELISLHLSSDQENPFQLGAEELALMPDGGMLINLSRGNLVDEDALFKALSEKKLSGAALDVFSKEPYQGPLTELDNIILTPHIGTFTKESRVEMEVQATHNVINRLLNQG